MGGAVAQLLWRRHPERVQGLVLACTAASFSHTREERLSFLGLTGLGALARATPPPARAWLTEQFFLQHKRESWSPWAVNEAAQHDWRMVLQAGGAIGGFSSHEWLPEIDVPTSVIVTLRDRVVPVHRQLRLVEGLRQPNVLRIDADHDACVSRADRFVPMLAEAVRHAAGR
jgi:3-oxoadipate enol-lactonase